MSTALSTNVLLISMTDLDDKHRLRSNDRLTFRVTEERDEPPKALTVTDSGELEIPSIGRINATNKTCKELAWEIKKILEPDYYRKATVLMSLDEVNRSRRGRVYVIGEVRAPGTLEMPNDDRFTVSKAIMSAGGFGQFAKKTKVKVTRKNSETGAASQTFFVDVTKVWEEGRTDLDVILQPEDTIFVDSKLFNM